MVGGSQGVRKGLICSGFNILLFFLHMPKGFRQPVLQALLSPHWMQVCISFWCRQSQFMSSQGFILLYHMIFESLIWSLPYICALLMRQMICLPPLLSPLVTHPPQMKAHQLICKQRCLILLVVHLGSFANAPSVLVRFHKSHMFVLNTFNDLGVIVVLPQELFHLMW